MCNFGYQLLTSVVEARGGKSNIFGGITAFSMTNLLGFPDLPKKIKTECLFELLSLDLCCKNRSIAAK